MSQAPTGIGAPPASVTQGRPQHAGPGGGPQVQRQFVNFSFYKLDPAFRRLPGEQRAQARAEFNALFADTRAVTPGMLCLTYSTVGLRAETDFMLWRISLTSDDFQTHTAAINRTLLGAYLSQPASLLAMTKRSMYIDKLDPFHSPESRTHIIPGKRKYIFVYPFVKTREWYLMPMEKRQVAMDEHIRVGNEFPSIKLNTTYSFGLDDQDFVVAFESEEPKDFLDLVQKLRETDASKYTVRDTPTYTCVQTPMDKILEQLF